MEIWILRFSGPRSKPATPRRLLVLRRSDDGGMTELEALEIEADHTNLPNVVETQVAQGRTRLVLDLIHERSLDSNDLAQLIGASKYAGDAGGELVLANPSARVREVFRLAHLNDVLPNFDSVGAAANHFSTPD